MPNARWHQVELAVCLGTTLLLLVLALVGPAAGGWTGLITLVAALLFVAQPPALIRLLDHFRPVAPRELWTVVGGAAIGLVAIIVLPYPRPAAFLIALGLYFGGVQGYVGWAAVTEARQRCGIATLRLWLTGAGAACATLLVLFAGVGWAFGFVPWFLLRLLLVVGTAAGYYLGLFPPAPLVRAWQEQQLVRLLRRTAERTPEDREDAIAEDLNDAASRALTASATAVLLGREDITVYASTEAAWIGTRLRPEVGLVGVAVNGTSPVVGGADECEKPLDQVLAGEVITVIPIGRSTPAWGVLVIVQRRASVYADADMTLVATLCRHAADVLDHARLMHEERRRQGRPAAPIHEMART